MYRYPVFTLLVASGVLITAGCSRSDRVRTEGEASREATTATNTRNTGTAFVRYVSAVDAHSDTDLWFGDTRLFSSKEAAKPTDYKEVPSERRDFVLRGAGDTTGMAIEKNSEGLSAGKHYTVVAYEDEDAKPVLKVFNDDESAPAAGKAKVRVIHAAPGMDPVSIWAPGRKDKLTGESRFSSASSWDEVSPVNGPLEVRAGDAKTGRMVKVPGSGIEAGKLYTLIVEGGKKTPEKMRVVELVNNPTAS